MTIDVRPLNGPELQAALPDLARLRMEVFRDWPYLYDGTLDYERKYLDRFAHAKDAVIVAAVDGGRIIGCATGCPMRGHADEFAAPFEARGYNVDRLFYFGESVLLTPWRGRGLGHRFFDQREAHARALGRFTHTVFCAVVRPDDHPARPTGYRTLDAFWEKRGYQRLEGVLGAFAWKDVGVAEETEKTMQFWMRGL